MSGLPAGVADRVRVVVGDITGLPGDLGVDAIVNAANAALAGGGGVDGAIQAAAGPALMAYTDEHFPGGCPTGSAVVSPAFELEAVGVEHVIHTVGPVWAGSEDVKLGDQADDVLLASCYSRSLDAAREIGAKGVAFPGISTGVYGFPKVRAAKIAVAHVVGDLARHEQPGGVVFCCFSEADAGVYREVIETFVQWTTGRRRCG